MVVGVFGGPLVDRTNMKTIMIFADLGAGLCTLALYALLQNGTLQIWHIYLLNIFNSIFCGLQAPANSAVVSTIVPDEFYVKASGLQSFSDGVVQVLAPVFATAMLGVLGIKTVIMVDFLTMLFAYSSLAIFVTIPATTLKNSSGKIRGYFKDLSEGFAVIKSSSLLIDYCG